MTNSKEREFNVSLSFLPEGKYSMEIFRDNEETVTNAEAYTREILTVDSSKNIQIKMYRSGGWTAKLTKILE